MKNWMFTVLNSSSLPGSPTSTTMSLGVRFNADASCLSSSTVQAFSALLNTAEGNAKRHGRQRTKFFDDARGSAIECAACLDASVAKRFVSNDRVRPGKEMLQRIVAMLTRLVDRFDTGEIRVRGESPPSNRTGIRPVLNSLPQVRRSRYWRPHPDHRA